MHVPAVFFILATTVLCDAGSQDALLARASNAFGVKLLNRLSAARPESNIFISPTSISAALGMVYVGARGETQAEFSRVLGYDEAGLSSREDVLWEYRKLLTGNTSDNVTLEVANSVLIQNNFEVLDSYKNKLVELFQAELWSVDFARDGSRVAKEVNEWVRKMTRGKIQKLLGGGLPMNTVMFLINAIYFKGTWETMFNAKNTVPRPFHNWGTMVVQKPTMALLSGIAYADFSELGFQAAELPYKGSHISMVILLPNSKTGLFNVRTSLSDVTFDEITDHLRRVKMDLRLPKFEQATEYRLSQCLQSLGLKSVFTSRANLMGICECKFLLVSDVIHKAVIEVNEEGTVAAAVTSIVIGSTMGRDAPIEGIVRFHVDRPFIFYIRDKTTGHILFLGEVQNL